MGEKKNPFTSIYTYFKSPAIGISVVLNILTVPL